MGRRSPAEKGARRASLAGAIALAAAGCASSPAHDVDGTAVHTRARPAPTIPTVVAASPVRLGRSPLGEPRTEAIPFTIQPIPGGRSALFVAQAAGEPAARVRRLSGASGAMGPLVELRGEHVYGAFDAEDDRYTLVSSDEARVCLATYRADAAQPEARGCAEVAPSAIVPLGDRLALLEIAALPIPGKGGQARPAKPAKAPVTKPAVTPAKPAKPAKPGKAAKPTKATKAGKKPSANAATKPTKHAPPRPPATKPIEIRLRWATRAGVFDEAATPTGLHFMQPLDGMALVDARPRPPVADLLWFEDAPKIKGRSTLGGARLMAGVLRADGTLDLKSRVAVADGPLDYGAIREHRAPRLAGTPNASVAIDFDSKWQCAIRRVLPALAQGAQAPSAACSLDPDRLAAPTPLAPAEAELHARLLALSPRRAPGQPLHDAGRAVWAGERAFFLDGALALKSIARDAAAAREEPAPFAARRLPIAWGAIAMDGEAIAMTGDRITHADPSGALTSISIAGAPLRPGLLRAPESLGDRRRAARIGASWWIARGDLVRVFPDLAAPAPLRGLAPEDSTALVGGPARGLLIEVAGDALALRALSPDGALVALPRTRSPVRAGFDACERAAGGAIVAGVSATDPSQVVAFAVDDSGRLGPARATPLPITAGELAVRLIPLPGGGALLTDRDRRHVVWLDDGARPIGHAAWPAAESDAACVDGRPARVELPSPTPGAFTRVADLATPGTCVIGDPQWTRANQLLWLGSAVSGLDAVATLGRLEIPGVAITSSAAPDPFTATTPPPVAPSPCPGEMVSIAGRYCVDRFEATIVDAATGEPLSPDWPTTPNLLDFTLAEWSTARERVGDVHARAFPLPPLAFDRLGRKTEPRAVPRLGARPNGYLTGLVAEAACAAAGKRLCTLDEFVTACRGEADTQFPYGDTYEDGVCNVYRDEHPAAKLHDNASVGHLDPRLNRVRSRGKPLFQRSGESPACRSKWGNDAIYDMVGNLDEWVDEGAGAFAGGFYSRSTRAGCDALVTAHPRGYLDYSTGVRCCKDAAR